MCVIQVCGGRGSRCVGDPGMLVWGVIHGFQGGVIQGCVRRGGSRDVGVQASRGVGAGMIQGCGREEVIQVYVWE